MKLLKYFLLFPFLLCFSASVNASVLTDAVNISTPAETSALQDNSVSSAFTSAGVPITDPTHQLGVGDIVSGVLAIKTDAFGGSITQPNQLIIAFSAQIVGREFGGPTGTTEATATDFRYNLAPVTSGLNTLNNLLGGIGSADLLSQFNVAGSNPTTFASNTIFAMLETTTDSTSVSQKDLAGNFSELKNETAGVSYFLDLTGLIANTFGGLNAYGSTDFFQAKIDRNDSFLGQGPPTLGDIALYSATHLNQAVGFDSGAFTLGINNTPLLFGTLAQGDKGYVLPDSPTNPSPVSSFLSAQHTSNLTFDARLLTTTRGERDLGYAFADDTTVSLVVTGVLPEPSSITLLAGGLVILGTSLLRRRRQAVA